MKMTMTLMMSPAMTNLLPERCRLERPPSGAMLLTTACVLHVGNAAWCKNCKEPAVSCSGLTCASSNIHTDQMVINCETR